MKNFLAKMAEHCVAVGKAHSALADLYEGGEGNDDECAALHKSLAMSHLGMAEHCVSCLKAMEPEITKAEAPDFSAFLKIEG